MTRQMLVGNGATHPAFAQHGHDIFRRNSLTRVVAVVQMRVKNRQGIIGVYRTDGQQQADSSSKLIHKWFYVSFLYTKWLIRCEAALTGGLQVLLS